MTEDRGTGLPPDPSARHVDETTLAELALGHILEPERSDLLAHLEECASCRALYDEFGTAVDVVLPAAKPAEPPAGFEQRVLSALGVDGEPSATPGARTTRTDRVRHRGVWLAAAAAAVVVAVAAALAGWLVGSQQQDGDPALAAGSVIIRDGDGERVGTAMVSRMGDRRVVVVSVSRARVGAPYFCRLHRENAAPVDTASWETSTPGGGTWVFPAPQGDLTKIELVLTESGAVWSSADLS